MEKISNRMEPNLNVVEEKRIELLLLRCILVSFALLVLRGFSLFCRFSSPFFLFLSYPWGESGDRWVLTRTYCCSFFFFRFPHS